MRKLTLLLTCILTFSSTVLAQFRFQDHPDIGQDYTIDSVNLLPSGSYSFYVHFNTSFRSISYTDAAVRYDNCQTQRGLQVKVYTTPTGTTTIESGIKCNNYGGNGNPYHVANTDSLINWMKKYTQLNAATADSAKNHYWKPAVCLFDVVNGDTTNQAFGCYPGKYKRVDYGFQFNFTGFGLSSDLSFTMDTYDPGNSGKTATYQLIVYLGSVSTANAVDTIEDFYVTGTGKKEVKLAEALGIDYSAFDSKKVYIHISTMGTDTTLVENVYDPIVIFDDFRVSWGAPEWLSPAVTSGVIYNEGGAGNYSSYTLDGDTGTVKLYLKDKARISTLSVINDVEFPPSKYQFLDSMGVFANDGIGNYTVPIDYTFHPSVLNTESSTYSDSYILIPAPATVTNDDILVLMKFKPTASIFTERIEVNNGVRFWWDVQTAAKPVGVEKVKQINQPAIHTSSGTVYIHDAQGPVSLYNIIGRKLGTYPADVAARGIAVPKGLVIISTTEGATKVLVP